MKKWVAYEREHKNNSVFTVSKKFNILSFSFYYVKNGLTSNSKYSIYRHHLAISSCGNHSILSHNAKSQGAKEGRLVVLIQCTARDAIQIQGRFWLGQETGQCCEMITGNSTFTLRAAVSILTQNSAVAVADWCASSGDLFSFIEVTTL